MLIIESFKLFKKLFLKLIFIEFKISKFINTIIPKKNDNFKALFIKITGKLSKNRTGKLEINNKKLSLQG